ncbi:MAG TPA: GNAT family N-acetyltransferase [Thermoanaerobaculia bacterium]|jgi:aminoglycoside 6'-N-acetyltransferase I
MTTPFRIVDLVARSPDVMEQTARLLYESFRDRSDGWPDLSAARREVAESLQEGKVSRVVLDAEEGVLGWIGGQPQYEGHVWEVHPLVVAASHRRRGLGRALIEDLEALAAARGALTLWAGSDDERGETSLSGVDLYADIPGAIRNVNNLKGHPYEFYLRLGFRIVGVMPDATGPGKPDIFLAKRIGR